MKKRGKQKRGPVPSVAEVRVAVAAACLSTTANIDDVLHRPRAKWEMDRREYFKVTKARTYAALALRCLFEDGRQDVIARLVGSTYPKSYINQIDKLLSENGLKWFNNDVFMAVIEAVERFQQNVKAKPVETVRYSSENYPL